MSRLTDRTEKGLAYLVNVKPDEQEVDSPYKNTLQCILDFFERLAYYEDLEEQGRLAVLPCKVGDTVWVIENVFNGKKVVRTVGSRTIDEINHNKLNKKRRIAMPKYIDADALTAELNDMDGMIYRDLADILAAAPSADVAPVRRGEWIAELEAKLAASQRRCRAAVEDINSVRMCHTCKHFLREFGMGGIECKIPCATIRRENFEWRGPQEAGKGE